MIERDISEQKASEIDINSNMRRFIERNTEREKQSSDKGVAFEKIFAYLISLFAFFFPLILIPWFGNPLIASKFIFLLGMAVLLIVVMLLRVLAEKKLPWGRTVFDWQILTFLIVIIISTLLSTSRAVSIFGNYGSFMPSLLGVLASVVIYFSISFNIKSRKYLQLIKDSALFSIMIASILGLMNFFDVFVLPLEIAKSRSFNLIGSSQMLGVLAAIFMLYSITRIVKEKGSNKYIYMLPFIILALASFVFGGLAAGVIILVGVVLMIFFGVMDFADRGVITILAVIVIAFVSSMLPFIKNIDEDDGYSRSGQLNSSSSWVISSSVIRDYPLFGTGPGTYSNDFSKYKPISFNTSKYSDYKFNYPSSDYLLYMGEIGILGLLAYLLIHFSVASKFRVVQEVGDDDKDGKELVREYIVLISLSIGLFFVSMNIVVFVMFFVLIALFGKGLFLLDNDETEEDNEVFNLSQGIQVHSIPKLLTVFVMVVLLVVEGFYFVQVSFAEVSYKRATNAVLNNDANSAYENYAKTIVPFDKINNTYTQTRYDQYRREYAMINSAIANSFARDENGELKKDLSQDETDRITALYQQALREIDNAIILNPENATNHVTKGDLFTSVLGQVSDPTTTANSALASYADAEARDPNNPNIKMKIGSLFFSFGDYERASQYFYNAARVKPDFANAYYNLALSLKELKDYQNAYASIQNVVRLLPRDSEDYNTANKELEILKELADRQIAEQEAQSGASSGTEFDVNNIETSDSAKDDSPLTDPLDRF